MVTKITPSNITAIASGADPDIVRGIVANQHLLSAYGIDTPVRLAHFFGQCAVETAGFTRLEENLFYTTSGRLRAVWPSRFKSEAAARPYLRNPEKLANYVYGGRLGNKAPGDGWKYRGSGLKNTTGLYNFSVVERETGIPVVANPHFLRRFPEALESACIYWKSNNLNRFADAGDVRGLTRAVQGGAGGLADRRIYTDRAKRVVWGAATDTSQTGKLLRINSRGEAVSRLQRKLSQHGYTIVIDGYFGPGTDQIVRQFQADRGLMVDGVVGPATWESLDSDTPPTSAPLPDDDTAADDEPPEPVRKSKRFWTWLTTGGIGTIFAAVGSLDPKLQLLLGGALIAFAGYAIFTMPAVRDKLGLN